MRLSLVFAVTAHVVSAQIRVLNHNGTQHGIYYDKNKTTQTPQSAPNVNEGIKTSSSDGKSTELPLVYDYDSIGEPNSKNEIEIPYYPKISTKPPPTNDERLNWDPMNGYSRSARYADRFVARMQKNFHLNQDNLPYVNHGKINEYACLLLSGKCTTVDFWTRHVLVEMKNWTLKYDEHNEHNWISDMSNPAYFRLTKSVAVTKGSTKGWNVGGKISAGTAPGASTGPSVGAEISGGYRSEQTEARRVERIVHETFVCPPGSACHVTTRTYYATINGLCLSQRWYDCNGPTNICENSLPAYCDQMFNYRRPCSFDTFACSIQVPLFENDGVTPLTFRILWENPLQRK